MRSFREYNQVAATSKFLYIATNAHIMFLKFAANYYATNVNLQLSIVAVNTLYAKLFASLLPGTRRKDFTISCCFSVTSSLWFRECEEIEGDFLILAPH